MAFDCERGDCERGDCERGCRTMLPPLSIMARRATNRRNLVVTTINCRKNVPLPQPKTELVMLQPPVSIEEFSLILLSYGIFPSLTIMISLCCSGNTWPTRVGSLRRQLCGQFSTPMLNIWLAPAYTME